MTQYIQYDEAGNITATVISLCQAPENPLQLVFAEPVDTQGKMVDLNTLTLIDAPEPTPEPEPAPEPEGI